MSIAQNLRDILYGVAYGRYERELKQRRVLLLRERLARATGRMDLADELAAERKELDRHA